MEEKYDDQAREGRQAIRRKRISRPRRSNQNIISGSGTRVSFTPS